VEGEERYHGNERGERVCETGSGRGRRRRLASCYEFVQSYLFCVRRKV